MTRGRGWVSAVALSACTLLGLREARADGKQECAAAYEQTQSLRDTGKLVEARKNALACTIPDCPGFIVKECTQWLTLIDASMPSLVFEVHDPSGAETGAVQVSLDGKPWLEGLDGKAKPIDPGPHVLRFTLAGAEPREESVQIREGEKVRKLTVILQKTAAAPGPGPVRPAPVVAPPAAPPPSAPPAQQGSTGSSVVPWVLGGVGVAGLVVGGVLGGLVLHDKSVATDPAQCSTTLMKCTTAGASAEQQGRALGPATTAALVVGGAGVAVGAVWLGLRRPGTKPQATGVGVRAEVTASGLRLRGSF
jgi:hypothetical protein